MNNGFEKFIRFIGIMGLLAAVKNDAIEPDMATLLIISYLAFRSLD